MLFYVLKDKKTLGFMKFMHIQNMFCPNVTLCVFLCVYMYIYVHIYVHVHLQHVIASLALQVLPRKGLGLLMVICITPESSAYLIRANTEEQMALTAPQLYL